MPLYMVTIERHNVQSKTVLVEADSKWNAEGIAMKQIEDRPFPVDSMESTYNKAETYKEVGQ